MTSVRTAETAPPGGRMPLVRMVCRAQLLLSEVISPGDLAVDLTAGNGEDTLFLFSRIGPAGRVLAFDLQRPALEATARRLTAAGAAVGVRCQPFPGPLPPGVHLVHASHDRLDRYLSEEPRVVMANLGYLPGGDSPTVTRPETTVRALEQSLRLLAPGGRLAVVVYVGHPGGAEEAQAVSALFSELPAGNWQVLQVTAVNRQNSPFLLVAEKKTRTASRPVG